MSNPVPASCDTRIQAVGKDILEHFRNLLMCATLLALGLVARNKSRDLVGSSLIDGVIGWGVIAVAAALALLNMWTGVNRLKQWNHWKFWSVMFLVAYVAIGARVMEVIALVHLERD